MNTFSDPQSRADFWRAQVTAAEAAAMSSARFCKENDLNYSQFMYWRQKCQTPSAPISEDKSSSFIKVEPSLGQLGSGLSVSLPNGMQIHGIDSTNVTLVRQLLEWAL
ncbi:hypothetical protein HGG82_16570 [Marinomonas sp. M1K-6]|jgi:hypothetical protein|uniref:IS66 family insertion sequence element accessory protein TnpB n=1 Tax=Marinomonas profundi TaxID=2726122 RepID=A0A847RB04_9GAMM|nr:hypothetical protein [Marinomonas profundi]NLQ19206.1 hypothetical protein [Marinomonas profundi]UDV01817.1 hypothetical protein J8N69_09350 [Marinomonas profundi]UDV02330.1 hypothetical protein J8N69_12090 [Marinomonas profundi]UDV03405.1 hypothetical protein J8N69_01000 [Marinomonas profundi]UDV03675.1 hypothetical protein J8N69_02515 [Marinomonas profundi]